MLITLDTNVLVRVFIDDVSSAAQIESARALVKKARNIYVPQLVQAELVWVLQSAYKLKKLQILAILEKLQTHSIFILQNPLVFAKALSAYTLGKADFADYLIAAEAEQASAPLYSFDKQLTCANNVTLVD